MTAFPRPTRILALDPGTKEMGFALLHGDSLIRYGVRTIKKRLNTQSGSNGPGADLITYYNPDVVILGKLTHPERKRNTTLKMITNQIKKFALNKGIRVQEIEPEIAIKFLIKDRRPSKLNAASLIAAEYPELTPYIPQKRRVLWTQKDIYWMNLFDALTLGLYYLRKRKKGKGIKPEPGL